MSIKDQALSRVLLEEKMNQKNLDAKAYETESAFCPNQVHQDTFRECAEQGLLFETAVPFFISYLLGTFTLDWWPMENLGLLILSIHLFYLRTFLGPNNLKHASWLFHFAVMAFFYHLA